MEFEVQAKGYRREVLQIFLYRRNIPLRDIEPLVEMVYFLLEGAVWVWVLQL
jgi:hypothetical protein